MPVMASLSTWSLEKNRIICFLFRFFYLIILMLALFFMYIIVSGFHLIRIKMWFALAIVELLLPALN